jgi:DNA polymerase-3 subunit gamma/tau
VTPTVPHQALYRRWRAQTFSQIVGQEAVVETLRNAVRAERVSHALLFVGPRGTGKTSLARIVAKALNCTDLRDGDPCDACEACTAIREGRAFDLVEIDAASNRGIDAVRELRERIHYPPSDLRRKVYILDEAHQITRDAWNALLKSLEEPPPFVVFMFASTEPSGFPPAILSRLQRYDVRRLTIPEIEGKLTRILEADRREAEPAAIRLIARLAAGGMRDAESMLDQLLSSGSERIDETRVRDLLGLADADIVTGFVDALVGGDAAVGIGLLDRLEERGRDMRSFLDQVVDALRVELVGALTDGGGTRSTASLASAARRLAAIDPDRNGVGGLRLQLELTLFAVPPGTVQPASAVPVARAAPVVSASPVESVSASSTPASTAPSAARADRPARRRPESETTPASAPGDPSPSIAEPIAAAAEPAPPPPAATPEPAAAAPASVSPPGVPADAQAASEPSPVDAAPATPPAAAPAPAPAGALEELLAAWPTIVARVSLHPPTKPLIVACRPVAVEGNVVTLGFPEEQAFLKDVAERKKSVIEQGIGESLGRAVAVRCVVANVELVAPQASDEAFLLSEAKRIFADDLVDVGEIT